jgi:energy-coupling factor transporter ATP-binding protein EcfA2
MSEDFAKTLCILLSGKAGVGKTTSANILKGLFETSFEYNTYIGHFAGGVKSVARHMGWDGLKDTRGRKLLQQIGGVGREYDIDNWCSWLFDRELPSQLQFPFDIVLVDDWRFPNESLFVKSIPTYNVFTVNIVAPEREILKGTPEYNDASETALDDAKVAYDALLYNEGSMEELQKNCQTLAEVFVKLNPKWKEE